MDSSLLNECQEAFIEQVAPFLIARPGGLRCLASEVMLGELQLSDFLKGKFRLEPEPFNRLVKASKVGYHVDEWTDDSYDHVFTPIGNCTLQAPNMTALAKAEKYVSGWGDCDGIYNLSYPSMHTPRDFPDFLVVDRIGIFLFIIHKPEILENAVNKERLSRFDGTRAICPELFEMLYNHSYHVANHPHFSATYDEEFFSKTKLAFRQMTVSEAYNGIESLTGYGERRPDQLFY